MQYKLRETKLFRGGLRVEMAMLIQNRFEYRKAWSQVVIFSFQISALDQGNGSSSSLCGELLVAVLRTLYVFISTNSFCGHKQISIWIDFLMKRRLLLSTAEGLVAYIWKTSTFSWLCCLISKIENSYYVYIFWWKSSIPTNDTLH